MGTGKAEKPEYTPKHGVLTSVRPAAASATTRIILPCPGFKVQVGCLELAQAGSDAHVSAAQEVSSFHVCSERWDLLSLGLHSARDSSKHNKIRFRG